VRCSQIIDNQGRYQLLINKRNEENLTEQEYQELLELSDQMEIHQTQRREHLTCAMSINAYSSQKLENLEPDHKEK